MDLQIQAVQLSAELETLASFSEAPAPAVTRVVFSGTDRKARECVKSLCAAAGLVIREDAVGNTFARWVGSEPGLAAIATGSHIDAVPNAGRYDGTVGVLGGLEAIRALQRSGFRPRRSLELVIFTSEEPTRFGIGCLGSRLLAGVLEPAADTRLVGKGGGTLNHWRTAAGFAGDLAGVRLPQGHYAAFIELHIEQGPLLERAGIPLGVVTAIAAPASLRIRIEGEGGHAGAVLMPVRKDALCAAAELVLAVESAAKSSGAIDTVATVGVCEVFPGAVNSIPSEVRLEVDVRDTNGARRDRVLEEIQSACEAAAKRRGAAVEMETINADPPAQCDAAVVESLIRACAARGIAFQTMVSRAYHDSLFMSRITPTAMLFIPCRGGVSHRADEYASPEAIANGVLALGDALKELAS